MITVRPAPPQDMPWLAERAGVALHPAFRAIEAVDDAGRIVAMVGYDGQLPNAVQLHIALEHPAALRQIIVQGFETAFLPWPRGLGKGVALAPVLSTNEASLQLVEHLGFRRLCTGKDYCGPGVDLVMFEMRREDCRWLKRERKAA